MVSISNKSKGNLHIDSMAVVLSQGGSIDLPGTWNENLVIYPELSLFLQRDRITVTESTPESLEK